MVLDLDVDEEGFAVLSSQLWVRVMLVQLFLLWSAVLDSRLVEAQGL